MATALRAAVFYVLLVFVAGFALGTIRTMWLAPALGSTGSVLVELPFMLAWSWVACGIALRRIPVPAMAFHRFIMGAAAFALLLAAEAVLSVTLGGLTFAGHLALYQAAPALLGLAAQILFALFPLLRR